MFKSRWHSTGLFRSRNTVSCSSPHSMNWDAVYLAFLFSMFTSNKINRAQKHMRKEPSPCQQWLLGSTLGYRVLGAALLAPLHSYTPHKKQQALDMDSCAVIEWIRVGKDHFLCFTLEMNIVASVQRAVRTRQWAAVPDHGVRADNELRPRVPLVIGNVVVRLKPDPLLTFSQETVVTRLPFAILHH